MSAIRLLIVKVLSLFKAAVVNSRKKIAAVREVTAAAVLTRVVSLVLLVSILSTSTFAAAPGTGTTVFLSFSEFGQDIRYSYLAHFKVPQLPDLSALSGSLASLNFLGSPILALIFGKNRLRKQERSVARIEIQPGQATIREGEEIAFTAVAYDRENNPVQGVGFDWQAADARQKSEPEPLPNGVFDPDYPGPFIVTARAGGASGAVQVLVVPDAPFKALKERGDWEQASKEGKQILKKGNNKPKVLRQEVLDLLAQPLPAPIENSTRMTKETVKDLDKWDEENKRRNKGNGGNGGAAVAAAAVMQRGADASGNSSEQNEVRYLVDPQDDEKSKSRISEDAVNSNAAAPEAAAMTITGAITGIDTYTRVVTGWAYNSTSPWSSSLSVYIDGAYSTSASGGLPGCPPTGGSCSFSFTVSDAYADNLPHTIAVKMYDWSTYTEVALSNSPQTFTFNPAGHPNWNKSNWYTADDAGLQPGDPANTGTDGAGSENYSFSAPIVSLGGRGLNVNLSLNYNSLLWHQANGEIIYDIDKGNPGPGWSLLGVGKLMDMSSTGGSMMVDMDGTRHPYAGTIQTGYPAPAGGMTYYGHTTDGSFIDYVSNHSPSGITGGTAYLPNGTIITYGAAFDGVAYPTQIKDRNGNYITIAYQNNQGPNITTITDTKGRVIQFNYDAYNYLLSVTGPAINPIGLGQNTSATQTYIRIHHRHQQITTNFSGLSTVVRDSNPYVIDAIYYPATNTGYWFGDNDSYSTYGMINKVVEQRGMSWTPGGSAQDQGTFTPGAMTRQMTYDYPLTAGGVALTSAPQYTQMTEDWVNRDTPPAMTNYSVNNNAAPRTTSITLPNGNIIRQSSYNHPGVWDDGLLYQVETISPANQVLAKSNTFWELGAYGAPRVTEVQNTDEKNQTTKQTFAYDAVYNQVAVASEYGYSNNLLRKSVRTYENGTAYTGTYSTTSGGGFNWNSNSWNPDQHIFSLVKTEEIQDAAGGRLSRTDYNYDGASLLNTPGVVNYDSMYNTTAGYFNNKTLKRGNVTQTIVYADAQNLTGAIAYDSTYDITGNARTITTNCCQQMSFNYTTNTQYSQPESHTKGSSDPNSPDRMTESAIYDFNTGMTVHSTDFNGRQSTYYYDAALRPVQTILPTGAKQTAAYSDDGMFTQGQTLDAANNVQSTTLEFYNGRGQVRASSYFSRATANFWDGANFIETNIQYDRMGRRSQVSMPHPANVGAAHWTTYAYDQLSRVVEVMAPDGSLSQTFYNESSAPQGAASNVGNTVRSKDAWGRERWARSDAFGRLTEVVEPDPNGTGALAGGGNLPTGYAYDAMDQLITVYQGAQARWFAYDSLGRLTRQKLAEQNASLNAAGQFVGANNGQWSDAFVYDQRSNLVQRTDARGVKTNFDYLINGAPDPLNRLQFVTYDKSGADATFPITDPLSVSLEYMTTGDKTRVKKANSGGVVIEENSYDIEGRISEYIKSPYGRANYPMQTSYLYDSLNRLTEVRYPASYGLAGSPRKVVTPSYDESSRLKELKVDNQIQMNDIVYNPMSQVTALKTGAGGGNADVETYTYEQATGLLINQKVYKQSVGEQTPMLNLSYDYNRGNSKGTQSGKTGQLTNIVNHLDRNKDRLYEFDALGRLLTAKGGAAAGSGATANWTQNYAYDRYGNRTGVTASGITANAQNVPTDGLPSQSYDNASNRINTSGYEYDLAGNLTRGQDAAGNWQRYDYDSAGRLTRVWNDARTYIQIDNAYGTSRQRELSWSYASTEWTWYVWGGSAVIAEYAGGGDASVPLVWKKSYVYAGSRLLSTATNNGSGGETVEFHHPDRLGTKLVTNNQANTSFEQSTLPFGTSLAAETTGTTNQRFTTYDRSTVASLDYAVNRHYSSGQGRFTSVDPIGMSATSLGNPQSMNLYAYVENNPVDFTDPSGLDTWIVDVPIEEDVFEWMDRIFAQLELQRRRYVGFPGSGGGGGGGGTGGGEAPPSGQQTQNPSTSKVQKCLDSQFGKGVVAINSSNYDSNTNKRTTNITAGGKNYDVVTSFDKSSSTLGSTYNYVNSLRQDGRQESGLTTTGTGSISADGKRIFNDVASDVQQGVNNGTYTAIGLDAVVLHELGNAIGMALWYQGKYQYPFALKGVKPTNGGDADAGTKFERCLYNGGIVNLQTGKTGNSRNL